MDEKNKEVMITLRAACERLGLNHRTVKNWISRGSCPFPTVKIGDLRMVVVADLDEFVSDLRRSADLATHHFSAISQIKRGRGRPRKMAA